MALRWRVSAYPSDVTAQMIYNFVRGGAAINVLSRHAGARVISWIWACCRASALSGLVSRKVAGHPELRRQSAMTPDEALACVESASNWPG
jgi:nicotinate-nucleotide--dimethylbenzimidazole phosphoribosyltransferase